MLIYLIQFCDRAGIDLAAAVQRKIEKNEKNYPADRVKGSAKKYTEYEKL
ncbi:MAG TPA: MazG-like family protein [Candidatus Paceibacterota bacterium]|nr:MazG-like family protein [Candidatus Paceibacterota bacterium]